MFTIDSLRYIYPLMKGAGALPRIMPTKTAFRGRAELMADLQRAHLRKRTVYERLRRILRRL